MQNTQALSQLDIQKLLNSPSEEERADLTLKLTHYYNAPEITESERAIIDDIFRAITKDLAASVRFILAKQIKSSQYLPADIAKKMIEDVDIIALPILEEAVIFTDQELVHFVNKFKEIKQTAIASRKNISETLSGALIKTGSIKVVSTLVANDGAALTDDHFNIILDDFVEDSAIHKAFIKRSEIPKTITERFIASVSDHLKKEFLKKHQAHKSVIEPIFKQGREEALATFTSYNSIQYTKELVQQIHSKKQLTSSLVLRMLCMGDIAFFEEAIAVLAAVPVVNTRTLIHDGGANAFESIYKKAALDPHLFEAFKVAFETVKQTELCQEDNAIEKYRRTIIERILTHYENLGNETLDYLLKQFNEFSRAFDAA